MSSIPRGDSDRQPPNEPTYTVGSLFSGIGGLDLAFTAAGFDVRWQVEIDPYCQKVLRKHAPQYWPNAQLHTDIYDCHDLPHVDVIVAGFPCQPYSTLGHRAGERDPRYLVPEMFRVIEEVRPYAALFENVPGFTTIDDGGTFKQFLRTLAALGYDAEWGRLYASNAGSPQYRERWVCVAYAAGDRHEEPQPVTSGADSRRHGAPPEPSRWAERHAIESSRQVLGGAAARGRAARSHQPRLDTHLNGLPCGLARHRFPAGQGAEPADHEPPRLIPSQTPDWKDKQRALGNSVVPQVVLPIAQAVREYLDAQAREGGAE